MQPLIFFMKSHPMEFTTAIYQLKSQASRIPEAGEAVKPVSLNVSESFLFQFWSFVHAHTLGSLQKV